MQATTFGETPKNIIINEDCEILIEDFLQSLKNDIDVFKDNYVIDDAEFVSKSLMHSLSKMENYDKRIVSVKNIIFDAAMDCERIVGGSSDTFFLIFNYVIGLHKDKRLEFINHSLEHYGELMQTKKRLSKSDINLMIKSYHPYTKTIINDILKKATPKTVIMLERSGFVEDKILKKETLTFDLTAIPGFLDAQWVREDVSLLMIDGVIDQVSEIHHLLSEAAESKKPYLLITKGYSAEVLKTIATNKVRGIVDIIPIDLGKTMDYHHFMNDISKIFDIQYASAEFGDVIPVFVRRGLPKLKKVVLGNKLELYIADEDVENLEKIRSDVCDMLYLQLGSKADMLIKKRMNYLSDDKIIISIGKDSAIKNPVIIEELDIFIRRMISLIRDRAVKTNIKGIKNKKNIYSSIEIPFMFNKLKSLIRSIDSIKCIILHKDLNMVDRNDL